MYIFLLLSYDDTCFVYIVFKRLIHVYWRYRFLMRKLAISYIVDSGQNVRTIHPLPRSILFHHHLFQYVQFYYGHGQNSSSIHRERPLDYLKFYFGKFFGIFRRGNWKLCCSKKCWEELFLLLPLDRYFCRYLWRSFLRISAWILELFDGVIFLCIAFHYVKLINIWVILLFI